MFRVMEQAGAAGAAGGNWIKTQLNLRFFLPILTFESLFLKELEIELSFG